MQLGASEVCSYLNAGVGALARHKPFAGQFGFFCCRTRRRSSAPWRPMSFSMASN